MGIRRNSVTGNRAIFLDRDGVLNPTWGKDTSNNPESPLRFEDFSIFNFVPEAIKQINELGYLAIVVTNQPAYAKGKMTLEDLAKMNQLLIDEVSKAGGKIEKIYACLHHPDPKQVVVKSLFTKCECRKPKPGMLLQAAGEFGINLVDSWMIGDSWKDIAAGEAAGCRTILISKKQSLIKRVDPDGYAKNLPEAIKIIERSESQNGWKKEN
jgi:histidinol-phosphate phosphatase family protein